MNTKLRDIMGAELHKGQRIVYNGYSVSLKQGIINEVFDDRISIETDNPEVKAWKYRKHTKKKSALDFKRVSDQKSGRVEVFVWKNPLVNA